jgi:integrase
MADNKQPEKRSFGEITRLSTGRYRARYRGPDGDRHNAPVAFLSRLDAETWLAAQHRKVSSGDWKPPALAALEGVKVADFVRTSIARRRLRQGTSALYVKLLRLEILPMFGSRRIQDITAADVTDWYNAMESRPTQQANAYGLLKSIMKDAVDEQIIERNPCRVKGGVNKQAVHEIKVLTPAQLGRYLAAVPADRRVPLLLAGWCGLRSGEVRGLRVQDLDLHAGVVRVRQAIVRLVGQLIIEPPKTAAGVRDVAIPPHLLPTLRTWMDAQPPRSPDALLFPASDGVTPLNDTVLRDAHYKGRKAIKMPHLTVHDLRHTSATMAAQQGATIAELQARIGHSTPNMALRYQHVAAHRDKSLAKRISEMAKEAAERTGEPDASQVDLIDHKPRKPQTKREQRPATRPRPAGQTGRSDRQRAAAIRDWATKRGYELAPTGRIPKDVAAAYDADQERARSRAERQAKKPKP